MKISVHGVEPAEKVLTTNKKKIKSFYLFFESINYERKEKKLLFFLFLFLNNNKIIK
jgi:hypothetical protein